MTANIAQYARTGSSRCSPTASGGSRPSAALRRVNWPSQWPGASPNKARRRPRTGSTSTQPKPTRCCAACAPWCASGCNVGAAAEKLAESTRALATCHGTVQEGIRSLREMGLNDTLRDLGGALGRIRPVLEHFQKPFVLTAVPVPGSGRAID